MHNTKQKTLLITLCIVLTSCVGKTRYYEHAEHGVVTNKSELFRQERTLCEQESFKKPRSYKSMPFSLFVRKEPKDVFVKDFKTLLSHAYDEYRYSQPSYTSSAIAVSQGDVNAAIQSATPTAVNRNRMPANALADQIFEEIEICTKKRGWTQIEKEK